MSCPRCASTITYVDYEDHVIGCVVCGERTPLPPRTPPILDLVEPVEPVEPAPKRARGRPPPTANLEAIVALLQARGALSTSEVSAALAMPRSTAERRLWSLARANRIAMRDTAVTRWEVAA